MRAYLTQWCKVRHLLIAFVIILFVSWLVPVQPEPIPFRYDANVSPIYVLSFGLPVLFIPQLQAPSDELEKALPIFPSTTYRLLWILMLSGLGLLALSAGGILRGLPPGELVLLGRNFLGGLGLICILRLIVPHTYLWVAPVALVLITWISGVHEYSSFPRSWAYLIYPTSIATVTAFVGLWFLGVAAFSNSALTRFKP